MINYHQIIEQLGINRVKNDEPMTKHTTVKIGGPAKIYYEAQTTEDLIRVVRICIENSSPYFVIGGGSNLLFSDKGFDGVIIKNSSNKIQLQGFSGKINKGEVSVNDVLVKSDSGVPFNQLIRFTIDESLEGFEYFLGQPGTVGGAIWINAHFMKQNVFIGDYVFSAEILTPKGEIKKVENTYFNFKYDDTSIKKSKDIVLSAVFKLHKGNKEELWQKGMESINFRKKTQPNFPSSGCTFQNIKKEDAMRLGTPNFTCSAGFLIDTCGLKGKKEGGAMISDQHANFIVNFDNANASDVKKLMEVMKNEVSKKFHIDLIPEVVLVGDF